MIYLDYAAATPMDTRVLDAMKPYFSDRFYNPSAVYAEARSVRADLEDARHKLAMVIGAKSSEIILTAGATESINLALRGVVGASGGNAIVSAIEHPAVLETAKSLGGKSVRVDEKGHLDLSDLRAKIDDATTIVSVGYVNNEIGVVQKLRGVSDMLAEIRADRLKRKIAAPLYFHTDASQAAGLFDLSVARLGVDLMTLNAAKCYGPKRVGLLYVRGGIVLTPLLFGGGQESNLRSGTESVAGAVGFARALGLADTSRKTEFKRLESLRDTVQRELINAFPDATINGDKKRRSPAIVNISIPNLDGERAVFALDEQSVMLATGSACAANKETKSHVLMALGLSDDLIRGSLRMSVGRWTSEEEVNKAVQRIIKVIKTERGK